MHLNSRAFNHDWLQKPGYRIRVQVGARFSITTLTFDDVVENFPDLFVAAFELTLGGFNGFGIATLFQSADDEWLEQFQNDLL